MAGPKIACIGVIGKAVSITLLSYPLDIVHTKSVLG